jgi:hypothetical protein
MRLLRTKVLAAAGVLVLAVAGVVTGSGSQVANAATGYTCEGGSIPAGTYHSITVDGVCTVDAGDVTVARNVTVAPDAALIAIFSDNDLSVGGNLMVQSGAVAVIGCGPPDGQCDDDSGPAPTLSNTVSIGGNLIGSGALAVILHSIAVDGNVVLSGGGGGVNCDPQDALFGAPAYSDIEDSTIGGNVVVTGLRSCWLGFIRSDVSGNAIFVGNTLADPDANEFVTNTIGRNFICTGNDPDPQYGDSGGDPDVVQGHTVGQCQDLLLPNPNPGGGDED